MTPEEIEAYDRRLGEEFAQNAIALACRLYAEPERQARELRYWYEHARAFPCHSTYSMRLLATEINKLEAQQPPCKG